MARGKKTDNQTIYNIMCSYFETRNYSQTSRDLDIPEQLNRRFIISELLEIADVVIPSYDANKQIVITSDKHPEEIKTLEEGLNRIFINIYIIFI